MTVHKSPVDKFPGEVVLPDYLTMPQVIAWGDAVEAAHELGDKPRLDKFNACFLPGIFACVQELRLDGFQQPVTPENFPGTPRRASAELVSWLIGLISALYNGEELPNG